MTNDRMVKTSCEWQLISTVSAGRHKVGWENDIKEEL
jgi:hypothetical protein